MKKANSTNSVVKMNLTLPRDFFEVLQQNARSNYMKTASWTKQFLMKHLLGENKEVEKSMNQNDKYMEI